MIQTWSSYPWLVKCEPAANRSTNRSGFKKTSTGPRAIHLATGTQVQSTAQALARLRGPVRSPQPDSTALVRPEHTSPRASPFGVPFRGVVSSSTSPPLEPPEQRHREEDEDDERKSGREEGWPVVEDAEIREEAPDEEER